MPNDRPTGSSTPPARTCSSTPTTRWTGTPGAPEALEQARREDRPIFLSIGYSACHWCHVMERESFEDEGVAALLNAQFVPIKVDREERPDLDELYMGAVQAITGRGGWPMSVWLTPELKPFYGGTYFPPAPRYGMPGLLPGAGRASAGPGGSGAPEVEGDAGRLAEALARQAQVRPGTALPGPEAFEHALEQLRRSFDAALGRLRTGAQVPPGHGGGADPAAGRAGRTGPWPCAPWTPWPKAACSTTWAGASPATAWTGSGWCRTSRRCSTTTPSWPPATWAPSRPPATRATPASPGRPWTTSCATCATRPAASTPARTPTAKARRAGSTCSPRTEVGGGPGARTPSASAGPTASPRPATSSTAPACCTGSTRRRGRTSRRWRACGPGSGPTGTPGCARPRTTRSLAAWNGLALTALARGFQVLGEARYLEAALALGAFLKRDLAPDGALLRVWRQGRAHTPGFLEDYAAVADGLVDLYEACFDPAWLRWAGQLAEAMVRQFEDPDQGGFFSSPSDPDLLFRQKPLHDGALPSGNTLAARALLKLAGHLERPGVPGGRPARPALRRRRSWSGCPGPSRACSRPWTWPGRPGPSSSPGIPPDPGTRALLAVVRRPYLPGLRVSLAAADPDLPLHRDRGAGPPGGLRLPGPRLRRAGDGPRGPGMPCPA